MTDYLTAWYSGFVRRWHCHPFMSAEHDEVAAHQGRCVTLLLTLFPDASPGLVRAVATHDAGEWAVGDIPHTHKSRRYAGEIQALEDETLAKMGFDFDMHSETDARRLKFIDRLDAYLFVRHRQPHILQQKAWRQQGEWLVEEAGALGVDVRL